MVQSPERLRLLLRADVVDIRAVGPGDVERLEAAAARRPVRGGGGGAAARPQAEGPRASGSPRKQATLARRRSAGTTTRFAALSSAACPKPIGSPSPTTCWRTTPASSPTAGDAPLAIDAQVYPERGATLVTIYAADHPGPVLPHRRRDPRRRRQHHRRAHPHHARRHGGRQFPGAGPVRPPVRRAGAARAADAPRSRMRSPTAASSPIGCVAKPAPRTRAEAFDIEPNVLIDNRASNRFTVVEVNARDRPALLNQLAQRAVPVEGDDPFRACRHLWRARGRHLLRHRPDRRPDHQRRAPEDAGTRLLAAAAGEELRSGGLSDGRPEPVRRRQPERAAAAVEHDTKRAGPHEQRTGSLLVRHCDQKRERSVTP